MSRTGPSEGDGCGNETRGGPRALWLSCMVAFVSAPLLARRVCSDSLLLDAAADAESDSRRLSLAPMTVEQRLLRRRRDRSRCHALLNEAEAGAAAAEEEEDEKEEAVEEGERAAIGDGDGESGLQPDSGEEMEAAESSDSGPGVDPPLLPLAVRLCALASASSSLLLAVLRLLPLLLCCRLVSGSGCCCCCCCCCCCGMAVAGCMSVRESMRRCERQNELKHTREGASEDESSCQRTERCDRSVPTAKHPSPRCCGPSVSPSLCRVRAARAARCVRLLCVVLR